MGRRPLVLVLVALLLAGCSASSEGPRQAPVVEPPQEAPPGDAPSDSPPPPSETQPEPAPVDVHLVHDYRGAAEKLTFEVPAGSPPVRIEAGFRNPDGLSACSGQDARLLVKAPGGKTLFELQGPTVNLGMSDCSSQSAPEQVASEPGTYTVEFTGQGAIVGYVEAVSTR